MGNFHDIHWPGSSCDVDAEAEQEATTHKLLDTVGLGCYTLDDGANNDASTSNNHAESSSESIGRRTNEGQRDNTTNLVHGSNDPSPDARILSVIVGQESIVGEKVVNQRTIVTVHCCAEEADETGNVKLEGCTSEGLRGLLEHCFVEGFISLNDLDLNFGMFLHARN
jgi:hypothetical protein